MKGEGVLFKSPNPMFSVLGFLWDDSGVNRLLSNTVLSAEPEQQRHPVLGAGGCLLLGMDKKERNTMIKKINNK